LDGRAGRAEALPFPNESFDVVTFDYVAHHVEHLAVLFWRIAHGSRDSAMTARSAFPPCASRRNIGTSEVIPIVSTIMTDVPKRSIRIILPLATITCTSMLAMDLYLPAVPTLQRALNVSVTQSQGTIAVFLLGLAASQLLWGEVLTRVGPRRCVRAGVGLLVLASIGCALAANIGVLSGMRLLQGIAAGVATVIAPSVVRATLSGSDAVRGIAAISMVESVIPAAGPVLGATLLTYTDWRGLFWILAVLTLAVFPFAVRATPHELPGMDRSVAAGYRNVLSNRKYRRLAVSHALTVGALLTFVASAPQLLVNALGLGASAFALLQIIGVSGFFLTASQSARISGRLGPSRAVQLGAAAQLGLCGGLLVASLLTDLNFVLVAIFWCGFCAALAVRGPPGFSEALDVPIVQMGRASAMLVLGILLCGAVGTQLVAPFMSGSSATPVAGAVLLLSLLSFALVIPYPRHDRAPAPISY